MRALIRGDLQSKEYFMEKWKNRDEYDQAVIDLFLKMGYGAEATGQESLKDHATVAEILEDMPQDVKDQELSHLIMLGQTSEGQCPFLVTAINPTEIHIRIKGRLFGRLRKACVDMNKHTLAYMKG